MRVRLDHALRALFPSAVLQTAERHADLRFAVPHSVLALQSARRLRDSDHQHAHRDDEGRSPSQGHRVEVVRDGSLSLSNGSV